MRRFLLTLAACLACLAAIPLVGCMSAPSVSAPAFMKDVDAVRADHDAAIAQVRSDLGGSIDQLRADVVAARSAGEKAFADAIASGKSIGEATADRVRAETAVAIQAAQDAMAKQKAQTDAAIAEANKKAQAAKDEGEKSTSPLGTILASLASLVVALGGGKWIAGLVAASKILKYDAQPFVDPLTGAQATEGAMVRAAMAAPTSRIASGPPPSTPPAV